MVGFWLRLSLAIKKIKVALGNNRKEIIEVRKEVSRSNFFHPNNAIRPGHLNENANLVDITSWIIYFRNYINSGYNKEVPKRGHYMQMRPILDKSWAISLDSLEANEVDLETFCNMLMDEGKNRRPLHQRGIQFMKAWKASNEKHDEWIKCLRTLVEVAELDNIASDELRIHVFTESDDQTMSKLAIEELAKKKPSLKQLTIAVKGTESSQW